MRQHGSDTSMITRAIQLWHRSWSVVVVVSIVAMTCLVSGAVSPTAAQAAPVELTTFDLKAEGTVNISCPSPPPPDAPVDVTTNVVAGKIVSGSGSLTVVEGEERGNIYVASVKATSNTITFNIIDDKSGGILGPNTLTGNNWAGYSGSVSIFDICIFTFTNLAIKIPPGLGKKPRAPKPVKVVGKSGAKKFRVTWKKPSTKNNRPITGYRVLVKAHGAKDLMLNKRLGGNKRSLNIKRSTLLKSLRFKVRGEANIRLNVRVVALNRTTESNPAKARFFVRP